MQEPYDERVDTVESRGQTAPPARAEPSEKMPEAREPAVCDAGEAAIIRRAVDDGFTRLHAVLEERFVLDRFRETQIDKLHAELQLYRADVVAKAVRPALQSMIRLHDDLSKVLDALRAGDESDVTPPRMLALLEGFRDDVEVALSHNAVSVFRTTSEEFDPRRQKAVRTVESGEQMQVGRIAARVRPGFEQGETLLEKERVAVYVLSGAAALGEEEKP